MEKTFENMLRDYPRALACFMYIHFLSIPTAYTKICTYWFWFAFGKVV